MLRSPQENLAIAEPTTPHPTMPIFIRTSLADSNPQLPERFPKLWQGMETRAFEGRFPPEVF